MWYIGAGSPTLDLRLGRFGVHQAHDCSSEGVALKEASTLKTQPNPIMSLQTLHP